LDGLGEFFRWERQLIVAALVAIARALNLNLSERHCTCQPKSPLCHRTTLTASPTISRKGLIGSRKKSFASRRASSALLSVKYSTYKLTQKNEGLLIVPNFGGFFLFNVFLYMKVVWGGVGVSV
jgi:hypothetical protein